MAHERCPFCGGDGLGVKGSLINRSLLHAVGRWVSCKGCSATGPISSPLGGEAEAWELWDRRDDDDS